NAAFLVVVAAMTSKTAMADATWFCAVKGSIAKYQVVGKELKEPRAIALLKGLGLDAEKYKILEDTPEGIVAVRSQTKRSIDDRAFVWMSVILINKQTGVMRELSFSTDEPHMDRSFRGQCEPG